MRPESIEVGEVYAVTPVLGLTGPARVLALDVTHHVIHVTRADGVRVQWVEDVFAAYAQGGEVQRPFALRDEETVVSPLDVLQTWVEYRSRVESREAGRQEVQDTLEEINRGLELLGTAARATLTAPGVADASRATVKMPLTAAVLLAAAGQKFDNPTRT